jgi:hypothetical protein
METAGAILVVIIVLAVLGDMAKEEPKTPEAIAATVEQQESEDKLKTLRREWKAKRGSIIAMGLDEFQEEALLMKLDDLMMEKISALLR